MKKITLALLMISFGLSAQVNNMSMSDVGSGNSFGITVSPAKADSKNTQGSKYLNEAFFPAEVVNSEEDDIKLRYNAYRDEMEFEKNGQIYYMDKNLHNVVDFKLPIHREFRYGLYFIDKTAKNGYLEVLEEGNKVNLLKRNKIILEDAKEADNSYVRATPARFKKAPDVYFIQYGEEKINSIDNSKKEILAAFPTIANDVKAYIKENKLNPKEEKDLISIVQYANTIL